MKEVKVKALLLDKTNNTPLVLLIEEESQRVIPIWIGTTEALAIGMALEKVNFSRPLTHDLVLNVMETLGAGLEKVIIDSIKGDVYYATLILKEIEEEERGGEPISDEDRIEVDARPSDAIVLALKASIPIFVSDEIMLQASVDTRNPDERKKEEEEFNKFLENFNFKELRKYTEENDEGNKKSRD